MITGSSGKGKTQLIKSLICNIREQGKNTFVLDFKNDFASDRPFVQRTGMECQFISFDGLPYNPLIPSVLPHPVTGELIFQCGQHISGISSILKETYGLGAQQEAALKNAIRDSFHNYRINPSGIVPYDEHREFPDFNDIGNHLRDSNPNAYNRLDPLFDLGIFRNSYRQYSFDNVLEGALIIDLSSIQSNQIKNALAKIVILSAHGFYNSQEHSSTVKQYFIFDEAHRILESEYLVSFINDPQKS